ncbi:MAG: hypothetical protein IJ367_02140, partial [Clostridia bacterium]|nr:hypothetical protein [Clostridia bacterium]
LYYASCCLKNCCWIAFYPGAMTFKSISGGITEAITAVKSGGDILQVLERTLKPATFFPIAVLGIDVLILLLLAVLSWIGIFKSYKKNWIAATLMLGVIAYIYVVSCQPVGIGSYSRFRIACSMLTAIFSAYGLETIVLFCKKRRGDQ